MPANRGRAVGTRRAGRGHQRRLGGGGRARRTGPRLPPRPRAGPGRRPGPGHRRGSATQVGPLRRSPRPARRRGGGAAGRTRYRHGARPGPTRGRWRCSPGRPTPTGCPPKRSPSAGPRREHWPARRPVHHPRRSTSNLRARTVEAVAYYRESARLADPGRRQHAHRTGPAQPVGRPGRHRPRRGGGGRTHRRRSPAPGRRPRLPGVCRHKPGPGAADARRLGRRAGGTHPGRRRRRDGRHRLPRLLPGMDSGATRRHRDRRDHAGGTAEPTRQ